MKKSDPDTIPPTAAEFVLSAVKKANPEIHISGLVDGFVECRQKWAAALDDRSGVVTPTQATNMIDRAVALLVREEKIKWSRPWHLSDNTPSTKK